MRIKEQVGENKDTVRTIWIPIASLKTRPPYKANMLSIKNPCKANILSIKNQSRIYAEISQEKRQEASQVL